MMSTRRYFLKSSGLALASFAAAPSFLLRTAFAQRGREVGKDHPVIIAIFQRGAADGMSMVVPFGDRHYYSFRPQIAIPEPARNADERTIDLDGFFGLHPALDSLKAIYDERHLAIVHAVGSPSNTRSHFDAQDYMESGKPDNKNAADGWLNRYMQAKSAFKTTPFRGVAIGTNIPRSLTGAAPVVTMTRVSDFGLRGRRASRELESAFAEMYPDTFDAVNMLRRADPEQYRPAADVQYPNSPFGQGLLQIAQLVKANVGLEVAFTDLGGWDTHANQGASRGQLAIHLKDFGDGLSALYHDLRDRIQNVVIVTMTEFGRTVRQNGSGGTDHGHASCMFVLGGPVNGGKVFGQWPGLAPEQLFEGRDLALTTDFRTIFAEILIKHMGIPEVTKVFPAFKGKQTIGVL